MAKTHLKGLNTLRFFAAALVVFDHGRHHLSEMGISFAENVPLFYQGQVAVNFFFVLSGFLISYLAINEIKKTGTINYKFFYIRRVLRIMPLYYLVLYVSIFLIGVIAPIFLNENKLGFPILSGTILFSLFLPNLVTPLWSETVGGLNILWSIGVEEQFYLLFPLIIFFFIKSKHKIRFTLLLYVFYLLFYWTFQNHWIDVNDVLQKFMKTLKFHYMLLGIFFATICHKYLAQENRIALKQIINNSLFQGVIFTLVLLKININFEISPMIDDVLSGILFAFLIVMVSHRESGKLFNYNAKTLSYFGIISYGIYLLHPLVSYFIRFLVVKVEVLNKVVHYLPILYVIVLLLTTLIVAHISYNKFELPFLKLKERFR